MTDLRGLLSPGMGTNELVAALGTPRWSENLGKGEQMWHFDLPPFPADDAMRDTYVAGVVVGIANGCLAKWGCSYVDVPNDDVLREQGSLPGSKGQTHPRTLQLFVVSKDRFGDGQIVDTERFPGLGSIQSTPALEVRCLEEVTFEERASSDSAGQHRTVWSFGVFLTQEDAKRLKAVTASNLGRKLLIVVGGEPIAAPAIRGPLETGSLVIECEDRLLMQKVRETFTHMERRGR